jgi:hypothetical protein
MKEIIQKKPYYDKAYCQSFGQSFFQSAKAVLREKR